MNNTVNKIDVQACESKISTDSQDVLCTCLEGQSTAVAFYDSTAHIGGLLHFLLPSAETTDSVRSYQYADTGIEKTIFSMVEAGAEWDHMIIKIAGAAVTGNAAQDTLAKRNILAARSVFWRLGLLIRSLDIGGENKRELNLNVADGTVIVRSGTVEKKM
jgi:chemotaxis protein CheD